MHWNPTSVCGVALLMAILIKVITTVLGLLARKRLKPVSNSLWWGSKLSALAACTFAAKVASDSCDELTAQVLFFALPIVTLLVVVLAWQRFHRRS